MSARKFRPLLLEVASRKSSAEASSPKTAGRPPTGAEPAPPSERPGALADEPRETGAEARRTADGPRPPAERPPDYSPSGLRAGEAGAGAAGMPEGAPTPGLLDAFSEFGRWLSSLTEWRTQAVAGCVLIVVLAFAFFAGRFYERAVSAGTSAENAPAEKSDAALAPRPVATEPPRVVFVEPGSPAATGDDASPPAAGEKPQTPTDPSANEPKQVVLQRGYHYLVIQYFPRSRRSDAEKAAAYLMQNGVPCALLDRPRDIQLLATEPFLVKQNDAAQARSERARADTLNQRLREIGKSYQPIGGYDFRGGQLTEIR